MKIAITKLVKLSICPCGYSLLHEDIQLGTEYTVYPEASDPEHPFVLICGGCGQPSQGKGYILARSTRNPDAEPGPLPLELFEIGNEWPEVIG